jgi:hypothetical protein
VTAAEYIAQAILRNSQNDGDTLAEPDPELLGVLTLQFYDYYQMATGRNPYVFATQAVLSYSSGGWTIPADAETVVALQRPGGSEVVVVPVDDLQAESGKAAVYRLGRRYFSAGNAADPPANTNLICIYTVIPPTFADLTDEPPTEWPTQFDPMVVNDLALFLAEKDERDTEAARRKAEQERWQARFMAWLTRPELNARTRFGSPRLVPTPATQPFGTG